MRTIGVVTVARSDYSIYKPLLYLLEASEETHLQLYVSGMHLSPEFGYTVQDIEKDGFEITERVEMLLSSDSPEAIVKSIGLGNIGFVQALSRTRPDLLVVLGDRFEMFAAALSSLPLKIPVAHIHGGELTLGAIDDALRHATTKLSHLHFVSTEESERRVLQLGEEPWRVTLCGAPSLDNLRSITLLTIPELEMRYDFKLTRAPILITYHPVTLEYEDTEWQIKELIQAISSVGRPIVFTLSNADTYGRTIIRLIQDYAESNSQAWIVKNLGTDGYFSLMSHASVMVGNSSSGIIEAPSFNLPVVNVGTRQEGRVRGSNVIDVEYDQASIRTGISTALDPAFRKSLSVSQNPYDFGGASIKILEVLVNAPLDRLLVKRFHDLEIIGQRTDYR